MKRIILHWTAGTYQPNMHEKISYHFLIGKNGEIYNGFFPPEANKGQISCSRTGKPNYAAHTGGGNSGSIGIALCGMLGYQSKAPNITKYPITKMQTSSLFKLSATLCKRYNIEIKADFVMTHYEFGLKNPSTTSAGKIDINFLHPYPNLKNFEIGDFIRNEIKKEYNFIS